MNNTNTNCRPSVHFDGYTYFFFWSNRLVGPFDSKKEAEESVTVLAGVDARIIAKAKEETNG